MGYEPMKQRHAIAGLGISAGTELKRGHGIPLILNLSARGTNARATIVEVGTGTAIQEKNLPLNKQLFPLLVEEKKEVENLFRFGRLEEAQSRIRGLGKVVYRHTLGPLGLRKLFEDGGYVVNIRCEGDALHIPLEIAFHNRFLFERNVLTMRGTNDPSGRTVPVRRALIIADPSGRYACSVHEGLLLHDFFRTIGLASTLIARPLRKEVLTDLISRYDIVHFSGHSTIDQGRTGWDIGRGIFTARDLLTGHRIPGFVFSSSCGSTLLMGLDFLRAGVMNCVCSRWRIPDVDLTPFILSLYHRVFQGSQIGLSFQKALEKRYRYGDVLPLVFILQGESEVRYEKSHTRREDQGVRAKVSERHDDLLQ